MGSCQSIADDCEVEGLIEETNFKKTDLQKWYKTFMKSYPDGQMDKEQFTDIYGNIYTADPTVAQNIFRSFDHNGDGFISFRELMISLSLSTAGTKEEKLQWLFDVYDFDGNGKITLNEVRDLATILHKVHKGGSIRRLKCDLHHTEDDDKEDDYISCVFHDIDLDHNGYWTLDEFREGVRKHPFLKKIIGK